MNEPYQALAAIIESCEPNAIIALGSLGQSLAQSWCQEHRECRLTCPDPADVEGGLNLTQVQDLALVTDSLEHLSHAKGQILLGQLRNYGTRQIAVLVHDNGDWTLNDFIGLGFRRQASLEENHTKLSLYTYNIDSYNRKRTWNNPRYWANPEMWGKARW